MIIPARTNYLFINNSLQKKSTEKILSLKYLMNKENLSHLDIQDFLKKNELLKPNYFTNSSEIPCLFNEISNIINDSIKNNTTQDIIKLNNFINRTEEALEEYNFQRSLINKSLTDISIAKHILFVMKQYMSIFYEFKIEHDITECKRKELKIADLVQCLEATEKLNDVSNGDSLPSQKEVDSFHLALGGYEKIQSIKNRILSKDYKLE